MDVFGIAASGMRAAQVQLDVTANNIANLNTGGYTAQRADLGSEANYDGVEATGVDSTGQPVDPAAEMVDLRQARLLYGANALVLKTADQLYGSFLNVLDNQDQQSNSKQQ
jgi:flagellar basal body rod protein FlgG